MTGLIPKPWGHEQILVNNGKFVVKHLHVKRGQNLSVQYHRVKHESMLLVSGDGVLNLMARDLTLQRRLVMKPDEWIDIPPGQVHQLQAGQRDLLVLEVSTPELEDVVRLKDDYGRV